MQIGTISSTQFVEGFNPSTILNENAFYEKKFHFSYSSLNKLLYCPEIFYREYILGDREEKIETYLTEGKLIHCLLLQPQEFDKQFITMTTKMPSENPRIVVDRVFTHHAELLMNGATDRTKLQEYSLAIIDVLKDINLYQALKTDEQRVEKIITAETVNYWDFLSKKDGKTFVDFDTLEKCKAIVEKVKNNQEIKKLLNIKEGEEWWDLSETHNELPLSMDLKKFTFGLKGILDNIVVVPGDGIIRINDIKTSSKTLKDFPESLKFYRYDIQAAVYNLLVVNHFQELIKQGYKVEFRFIVIDKNQQFYPFLVSEDTMKGWMKELQGILDKANYHYTNKDYTLPYEFTQKESFVL
jgi:hypothetical protein